MTFANDIRGTAFKESAPVLLARIVGPDAEAVVPADLATCHYSVLEVDYADHDTLTPVAGHDNVELDVDDVFYDSLQTGGPWSVDATGYNFRHTPDIDVSEAFPAAGVHYQVRYEAEAVDGHRLVWRYLVTVI